MFIESSALFQLFLYGVSVLYIFVGMEKGYNDINAMLEYAMLQARECKDGNDLKDLARWNDRIKKLRDMLIELWQEVDNYWL